MFRKLSVLICFLSFAPVAVNAQGITTFAAPTNYFESTSTPSSQPEGGLNLSLPTERTVTVLMAATETSQGIAMASPVENKKEVQRSSFNWGNFAEVHLGDYRWVWWAAAGVALIAIHAGAD